MKSRFLSIIALLLFSIVLMAGCNKLGKENTEDKNAYFTCPMHLQIHEHKPGKCHICGMDLVKKDDPN